MDIMKKLLLFNLLVCFYLIEIIHAQTYDWALSMGSTVGESSGEVVTADGTGNVFVAGYYSGTIAYDPLSSGHRGITRVDLTCSLENMTSMAPTINLLMEAE